MIDDESLKIYLDDCQEQLDSIEGDLLELEKSPDQVPLERIHHVFRAIHSIKGGAGMLGFKKIESIAHKMEDFLNLLRNQSIQADSQQIAVLLKGADLLRTLLSDIHDQANTPISDVLIQLEQILIPPSSLPSKLPSSAEEIPMDALEEVETPVELSDFPKAQIIFSDQSAEIAIEEKKVTAEGIVLSEQDGAVILYIKTLLDHAIKKLIVIYTSEILSFQKRGFHVYILQLDLVEHSTFSGVHVGKFLASIEDSGIVIVSQVVSQGVPGLLEQGPMRCPFISVFASVLERDLLIRFLKISPSAIEKITQEFEMPAHPILPLSVAPSVSASIPSHLIPATTLPKNIPTSQQRGSVETTAVPKATPDKKESGTIRVSVDLLDSLMNLAGELVLTRNQLVQNVTSWDKTGIESVSQRLNLVTSELQESIMFTRMQPIGVVFSKFQRVVRDIAKKIDKSIDLVIEGDEVELDKTILESMGDPLTHLVRNAVDHGIESRDRRIQAGKPETGTLKLVARHEAGHVVIEISDDGGGIDAQRIKEKALEKGIKDKTQLDAMPEREILKLIFTPGFSTAAQVTDISGRGVGMDVVHTNLSKLRGTIDIDTEVGKGTTFKIKLPLTLAIIPSLLVSINRESYAIPQVNLVELVRIPPDEVKQCLEHIGDSTVMRLRGKLLPVIHLRQFLKAEKRQIFDETSLSHFPDRRENLVDRRAIPFHEVALNDTSETTMEEKRRHSDRRYQSRSSTNIVVVAAGDFHYGIVVDQLLDSEEIVVKPLGIHLQSCVGYAGATILGDGRAALILDVTAIASLMNLVNRKEIQKAEQERLKKAQQNLGNQNQFVIIENAVDERFAIQLALVTRIERISRDQLEVIGNKRVIQYLGNALPIFSIDQGTTAKPLPSQKHFYLIIFPVDGNETSIIVSSIIDVVTIDSKIDHETFKENGINGSLIIDQKLTLLLDLYQFMKKVGPSPEKQPTSSSTIDVKKEKTILVVDDSKFFRDQIQKILKKQGHKIILAEDGLLGFQTLLKHAKEIDLVCSDVEMPNLDGVGMVKKIRADHQFNLLPIILLTSLSSDDDVAKGKAAGANDYLVKIDQELLVRTVTQLLGV